MNKLLCILFLLLNIAIANSQKTKVLFIGNSHTYKNDLPDIFRDIADSKGDSVIINQSTKGGYKFFQHVDYESTLSAIKNEKWDFIVLQEGIYASLPTELAKMQSYPFALKLYNLAKESNPDAKVILYMQQAYYYGTSYRCPEDAVVCNYEGMLLRFKENYINKSNLLNSEIAPCGIIWDKLMETYDGLQFYDTDYYHPGLLGSYVSACAIYSAIFNKTPKNSYFPIGLDIALKDTIHNTVQQIVLDENSAWNLEIKNLQNFKPYRFENIPDINAELNKYIEFTIEDYVFIDDDTLSISAVADKNNDLPDWLKFDPITKTFSGIPNKSNSLKIIVTATDKEHQSISDTFSIFFSAIPSSIHKSFEDCVLIYPNPAKKTIVVNQKKMELFKEYQIHNSSGVQVQSAEMHSNTIDVSDLDDGLYVLILKNSNSLISKKFLIKRAR